LTFSTPSSFRFSTRIMHEFQDFVMAHMHAMLIGHELFQTRPVFHCSQLTDPLSKWFGDVVASKADFRIRRCRLMTAVSAAVTLPLNYDLSILRLNRPTSASPILHRPAATVRMIGSIREFVEPVLHDDPSGSPYEP
jgi:hypothetical protein